MSDIEFEIDGKKVVGQANQTVIQVADAEGIYIPRFCYHKHLSIPANCRMCLVEVEKAPKALPACATPIAPGMKVFTRSAKTQQAQRAVMEFLLINHPLDCPICDQGGECELQDLSMGYGHSCSEYDEAKRSVADQDLGPLIATDMTRCIYCTRCVRFGKEIAGLPELGVIGRGEFEEISTYVQHAMQSEVSGNVIDLCPVGALTSKPYRFTARAWELQQTNSISPHDCVGSNLHVHTLNGKVMRVVAKENQEINETWISDRDRFAYTGLYHADRLEEPMAKINGTWRNVEWQTAFELIANSLQESIAQHGIDQLGGLISPNATLEECYLMQKIVRGLGSAHIDHRLRAVDVNDQAGVVIAPETFNTLAQADAIILLGSNIQKEQPILGLKVRQAALKGAAVIAINPADYAFHFPLTAKTIVAPHLLAHAFIEYQAEIIKNLKAKKNICLVLGAAVYSHPQSAVLRHAAQQLAQSLNAKLFILSDGANSVGATLAGAVPHLQVGGVAINNVGLSAYAMLAKPRKTYLLMNVEPDKDCANSNHAIAAMRQAHFIAALSLYRNPVLEEHAQVILPLAAFSETSGTFVNASGQWQSFQGCAKPFAQARPGWKILRVLANFLNLPGFDYQSSEQIKHEVHAAVQKTPAMPPVSAKAPSHAPVKLSRVGEVLLYATDSVVRRATPLQSAQSLMLGKVDVVKMHPETAAALKLQAGQEVLVHQLGEARLTLVLDKNIPPQAAWVAGGIEATNGLGDLYGEIEISA
jgi:NADH-quinone oxidoreductase subunit G